MHAIADTLGYDLRLMSVAAADGLVNEGRNLVIVALVGTDLHIRIFDASGKKVVDKAENELVSGETLTALKKQLTPIRDESGLSKELKQKIIRDATSIAGDTHTLDPRFGPYVDVYNNLDSLTWQVPGFFMASAAIVFGFVTSSMAKDSVPLPPVVWVCFFLFVGLLFLIVAYSMYRIRGHHTRMGNEIMRLEPSGGYFHVHSKSAPLASRVFMVFVAALGLVSLVAAAYLVYATWLHPASSAKACALTQRSSRAVSLVDRES